MQVRRVNPVQRDRVVAGEMNHDIAGSIVADQTRQRRPVREAVILHIDQIVFRCGAADGLVP